MEFALVAGLVVTLFFAMLEFGLLLDDQLAIAAAARSGARLAAVEGGDTAHVRAAIAEELQGFGIDPSLVQADIHPRSAIYGTPITVALAMDHELVTPVLAPFGWTSVRLRAAAVARSEKLASP